VTNPETHSDTGTGAGAQGAQQMQVNKSFTWDNRITTGNVLTAAGMFAAVFFFANQQGQQVQKQAATDDRQDREILAIREGAKDRNTDQERIAQMRYEALQRDIKSQAERQELVNAQILQALAELKSQNRK
jgi:hypothetical protein